MIELAVRIIETQQQRADLTALALKSKATNYAVRRSQSLHIDHDAFARLVNILQTIGNHTIGGPISVNHRPRPSSVTHCQPR